LNLDTLTIDRDEFMHQLRQKGIGTSVHFIPIPLHPYFAPYAGLAHNRCPRALELYPRLVSLPLYPAMSEEEVDYVAESIKEIVMVAKKMQVVAMTAAV
jgi:dTDP-4-amino-4,6-dideoxygalactose transaminase